MSKTQTMPSQGSIGRPLDGVRVLAMEQVQAMPFATLMLARLGAEVVKLEPPVGGETGRMSSPQIADSTGAKMGATFLRYAPGKKSIGVDIRDPRGRDIVHELAKEFDIVCENLGPGRAQRFGVDYQNLSEINPRLIYLSISGFGNDGTSPYARWPAFAGVAEAMSGIYEHSRLPHKPPVINPLGGVGDTGTGLFSIVGVLAALIHRDRMGFGQQVDISMLDAMVSIADIVPNYWSMGVVRQPDTANRLPAIMGGFAAKDGYFMLQAVRRHQFERIANLLQRPEWLTDPRLATPWDWGDRLEDVFRPAIEAWASDKTKLEAAQLLAEAGVAAAPCSTAEEVARDPHVAARKMLVEIPREDGGRPVLIAGNPIKLSLADEADDGAPPLLGQDTDDILSSLSLDQATLEDLRRDKVIF